MSEKNTVRGDADQGESPLEAHGSLDEMAAWDEGFQVYFAQKEMGAVGGERSKRLRIVQSDINRKEAKTMNITLYKKSLMMILICSLIAVAAIALMVLYVTGKLQIDQIETLSSPNIIYWRP